ncbi:MAG: ABC transporter permease [Acidobacteria bacterium]|nr:ABC transporter permease [Acidobacteriota bacterium]
MPDWSPEVRTRLRALSLDAAREAEIVEELSQHLEQHYEDRRRHGATDEAARRSAVDELLGPEALASYMRPLRQAHKPRAVTTGAPRRSIIRDLAQDLRHAFASLTRQPGFAAGAILTLALGIGANSAIFALVDATLLRPLPLPAADRLVTITGQTSTSLSGGRVSPNDLSDVRERSRSFEHVAGFMPNVGGMVMAGRDGTAETVSRQWVTAGLFDALGAPPVIGRYPQVADDRARTEAVVLSESFWRARFNADPAIVGSELRLDGDLYTVFGVAPDSAQVIGKSDLWAMLHIEGAPPRARGSRMFVAVGRMKPGLTTEAAGSDLSSIAQALSQEYPETNAGRGVSVERLDAFVVGADLRQTSVLFIGVVLFVLLICCANVANLLLARATARSRELAVRAALGADRARLIRQLLTESLLLSAIGGVLGFALGAAILRVAPAVIPVGLLPPAVTLAVDIRLVLFCVVAALTVGVIFGLLPAWQATAVPASQALAIDSRTTVGGGGRLRNALVAAEVATAVLLLVGAGLLLRTLVAVETIDRGYRASSTLTMVVDPLGSEYPTSEKLLQFYDAVANEVGALPGVADVAWASTLPLGESYAGSTWISVEGDTPRTLADTPTADYQIVNASYFRAVDLPVVEGRAFDESDTTSSVPVCIVNEAYVRAHLNGRSPIGARVVIQRGETAKPLVREIVGVARQVKSRPDETEEFLQVYVPMTQAALDDNFLIVRPAVGSASALTPSVRAAIGRVDRAQLVSVRNVMTLEDVAWDATARHRFRAVLVTAFAVLALVLAMVGLFGILAYMVQRRMRDLGVRRALGATTIDVVRVVIGSAARVLIAGVVIGVVLAIALGRLLASLLFGVAPLDPLTFAAVLAVLLLTAAVAIAGPAWRATRVDPVEALRSE